ncbi:MAG: hypothetical protein M3255_09560, partial [Pseudomonadota bacterium]|nr:hypothetical protein [Pseudomonadota bacterium]
CGGTDRGESLEVALGMRASFFMLVQYLQQDLMVGIVLADGHRAGRMTHSVVSHGKTSSPK